MTAALVVMLPFSVSAQTENTHHHSRAPGDGGTEPAVVYGLRVPDIELLDQHGRKVRFYSDLVRGRLVAINTIFTTCTTICPLMGANFSKLSRLLGSDTRGKFNLISISIDPVVDTPERLAHWSSNFGEPGIEWTLLTGAKSDIDNLLKALQVFTADKRDHAPVVLIGGEGAGDWVRASALLPPARISELIHERLANMTSPSLSRP